MGIESLTHTICCDKTFLTYMTLFRIFKAVQKHFLIKTFGVG